MRNGFAAPLLRSAAWADAPSEGMRRREAGSEVHFRGPAIGGEKVLLPGWRLTISEMRFLLLIGLHFLSGNRDNEPAVG